VQIRVISPTSRQDLCDRTLAIYQGYAARNTKLSLVFLEHGPESIESDYDAALAVPDILAQVRLAEREGIDAVVIDCMTDPGLFAARELASIPIVGPAQAAMSLAATLADRFSVIGVLERDRPVFHNLWRLYDLTARGASIRSINTPVASLHHDTEGLVHAIIDQCVLAVAEDGAHAVVLGCTDLGGLAKPVQEGLEAKGYDGVPVIDPPGVALKLAESLVALRLSHSKQTFPAPPQKQIVGYEHVS
jgi:allantoin racemase